MTATDELRRMLDERGVEWYGDTATYWGDADAVESVFADNALEVSLYAISPEQAIAATLGRGECHDEGTFHSWGYFTCSNCKVVVPVKAVREAPSIGKVVPISFCPNCGRRVKVVTS